jgi:hypothetical protein
MRATASSERNKQKHPAFGQDAFAFAEIPSKPRFMHPAQIAPFFFVGNADLQGDMFMV